MPTLINKINRAHWNSLLKADYSILAQAHQHLANEDDGFVGKLIDCPPSWEAHACFKNLFTTRIKKVIECDNRLATDDKCFPAQSKIKLLNGAAAGGSYLNNTSSAIVLANGSSMIFYLDSNTCELVVNGIKRCGWATVDVNGAKGPNTFGKDIYVFYIMKEYVKPLSREMVGASNLDSEVCDKNGRGFDCASYYLIK